MSELTLPSANVMPAFAYNAGYANWWSYLSTTLPDGIDSSALVALYQFDETASYLNDRSGNGQHLSLVAGVVPLVQVVDNLVGRQYYDDTNGTYTYAAIDGTLAALARGAFTFEAILATIYSLDVDTLFGIGGVNPDVEANNVQFAVMVAGAANASSSKVRIFGEQGVGVNIETNTTVGLPNGIHHLVVTRNADGLTHNIYTNGTHLETVVAAASPTGGTNARIYVGDHITAAGTPDMTIFSLRLVSAEYTAAQVTQAYARARSSS